MNLLYSTLFGHYTRIPNIATTKPSESSTNSAPHFAIINQTCPLNHGFFFFHRLQPGCLNWRRTDGLTPLMIAEVPTFRTLIKAGADVYASIAPRNYHKLNDWDNLNEFPDIQRITSYLSRSTNVDTALSLAIRLRNYDIVNVIFLVRIIRGLPLPFASKDQRQLFLTPFNSSDSLFPIL